MAACFNNTRLCFRDFLQSIAEIFGMLQTDIRNNRCLGAIDHVRTVKSPSHAYLKHNNIAVLLRKVHHRDRGNQLELAGVVVHRLCNLPYTLSNIR